MDDFERDMTELPQDAPETTAPDVSAGEADAPETPDVPLAAATDEAPAESDLHAVEADDAIPAEAGEAGSDIPAEDTDDDAPDDAVQPEEDEAAAPAADPQSAMDAALVEELEGIRDFVQRELDRAEQGELIQELDEIADETPAAPEEIPEAERCACCGERRRDVSFGEDYPYCSECRDLMKAAPFKGTSILALLVMFIVAGVSLVFCANSVNDYATLLEAETHYVNHEVVDAESAYYAYVQTAAYADSYSRTAVRNLITMFAQMGYLSDANTLISQYYTDAQLKLPWNKKIAAIAADYERLSQASAGVSALVQDVVYNDASFDFEAKEKELDALLEDGEDGTPGLAPLFVEYYRFLLMNLAEKPLEDQLEQLYHVEEIDDGSHPWLYLTNILTVASKLGEVDTARAYFDRCMKINVQETTAYTALANAYRFTETPDPAAIREVAADEQAHAAASAVPTYLLSEAIADLLEDDVKAASEKMETYFSSGAMTGQTPYTVQSCNLYALCCALSGDKDGYAQMETVFASADMEISPLVRKVKAGKLTALQALTDNGGDI